MSDSVAAPKAKATKIPSAHPPYINMIKEAVKQLKDKKGASKQAILKYISANYKLGDNVLQINSHLRQALKRGVTSKALLQSAGTGANGRFRVPEKAAVAKKPAAPKPAKKTGEKTAKPKKTAAAKVKKPKAVKKVSKPTAKKVSKSPVKKAVKPAAKKATKA